MKKRILAVMLTICLLFCSAAMPVGAETENEGESVSVIVGMVNFEKYAVGDRVAIPVYLSEVKYGYYTVGFQVLYDYAELEFIGCDNATWLVGDYPYVSFLDIARGKKGGYSEPFSHIIFKIKKPVTKPFIVTLDTVLVLTYCYENGNDYLRAKDVNVGNGGFYNPFEFSFGNLNTSALPVGSKIEIPVYLSEWKYGYSESTFSVKYDKNILRYEGKRGFGLNSTTDETTGEVHFKFDAGAFCGGEAKELGYLCFSVIDQITDNSEIELSVKNLKIYTSDSSKTEFEPDIIESPKYVLSKSVKYGDVDGDGVVTVKDALMTLQAYVKTLELTDSQKIAADVDGESGVSIKDALFILQYFVGIVTKFPVEM